MSLRLYVGTPFVFTTTSGQEDFPRGRPSSDMLIECKRELNKFFSHCIVLTACLCLHEATCFLTFNLFPPK